MNLTTPAPVRYTRRATSVAGLGSPMYLAAKSRTRKVCGFFVRGPGFGGPNGRAQALPVNGSPPGARSSHPFGLPPSLGSDGGSFKLHLLHQLESIMATTPARRQAPRIALVNGQPTTTSRDIAETFGKRHTDVLERIRKLDCSPEFNARNFPRVEYVDAKGETRTEYRITRDGFAFLCMGFTGSKAAQWKERYIAHFNRLEQTLRDRTSRKATGPRKIAHTPKALPAPASTPAPGLDARTLLLTGQAEPMPMPLELQTAIDQKAWQLAGEASTILREHLARRVPWRHVHGTPRQLQVKAALSDIASVTLGQCLAHTHATELRNCLASVQAVAQVTQESAARIQQALAELEAKPS